MGDSPDIPEADAGQSREQMRSLRESFDHEERERVERTVADVFELLGRAHTMAILGSFAFADGPLRFGEIEEDLDIAPNTLSTRLSELTETGLLERNAYNEIPPRVEYSPTEKGQALFPVFAHLYRWAVEYDL